MHILGVVVAVVVVVIIDASMNIDHAQEREQQYYASKCVLKIGFGIAAHTQDLGKSEDMQHSKH